MIKTRRNEDISSNRTQTPPPQDLAQLYQIRPLKGLDLHHMHDRLRTQRLTPAASREIYLSFHRHVNTYDEICLLLSVAPESHAGLFYLALGLFHRDRDVRARTADLLERVSRHDAGVHWWRGLSKFEKLAFQRIRREVEAARLAAAAAPVAGLGQGQGQDGAGAGAGTASARGSARASGSDTRGSGTGGVDKRIS